MHILLVSVIFFTHLIIIATQDGFDSTFEMQENDTSPNLDSYLTMCLKENLCNYGDCVLLRNKNVSCRCDKYYVDHDQEMCAEKGKSKLILFLLSFFGGGLGADWFYMSNGSLVFICIGILKISLIFVFALCNRKFANIFYDIPILGILWWFADWVRILSDGWGADGQGVGVYDDM